MLGVQPISQRLDLGACKLQLFTFRNWGISWTSWPVLPSAHIIPSWLPIATISHLSWSRFIPQSVSKVAIKITDITARLNWNNFYCLSIMMKNCLSQYLLLQLIYFYPMLLHSSKKIFTLCNVSGMFFDNFRCNASWEVKWDRPETCPESRHIFVVGFCSNTTTPTAPHHNRTSTQQFLRGDQRSVTLTWLLEHWEFWQITGRATRPAVSCPGISPVKWSEMAIILNTRLVSSTLGPDTQSEPSTDGQIWRSCAL